MRIQVTPERLHETARLFQQAQAQWQDQGARLQAQFSGLDWEASQQVNMEGQVAQVTRLANNLAQHAGELATSLESAAARFEQADSQGAAVLGASVGSATLAWLQGFSSLPSWLQLSNSGLSGWERLSALLGAPLKVGRVSLPVSGGNALLGLSFLASLPWLGGSLQSLSETVWNWLHGYGWRVNAELSSPLTTTNIPEIPKGKLAETVLRGFDEQTPPSASPSATTSPGTVESPTIQDTPPNPAPVTQPAVPTLSQQGLTYNGKETKYGCTAASTSMVLEYWHGKNSNVGTLSAQEIVDINTKQGTFDSKGLSVSEVHDEVKALGYSTVEDRVNSNFEMLKQDVQQGPVVAIVKLGLKKSGDNHAVVVTGISDDGQVMINDPWDGQAHTYTAAEFQSSWGADFGGGLKNMYAVIRP